MTGKRQMIRWLMAAVLFAAGIAIAVWGQPIAFLGSLGLFAIGTMMMIKELTRPLTWLVDSLFGTGVPEGGKPPLDLRLARHYVKQERLDEALEEYLRMMKYHPHVSETYEQAMILTAQLTTDRAAVDRFFRKGKRRIKDRKDQANLRSAYDQAKEELGGYGR